jgi:hypothetical protein
LALVGLRTTRLVTQECTRFLGRRDSAYANYTSGSLCGRAVADYAHTWPLLRVPPNQHRVGPLCQLEVSRDTKTSTGFVDPIPYSFAFGPPARVGSIRVCRKTASGSNAWLWVSLRARHQLERYLRMVPRLGCQSHDCVAQTVVCATVLWCAPPLPRCSTVCTWHSGLVFCHEGEGGHRV